MQKLHIGSLELRFPVVLAPIAGISDLPFRMLNRGFGCELAFTEMISARSLRIVGKRTEKILATLPADRPLGIQLVGSDPDDLRGALDVIAPLGFDVIDFNAACPVKKVTRRGEGAALLKSPRRLRELLSVLAERAESPVTVKLRTGWDKSCVNALEAALQAREAGVQAVFIHGRTRSQMYSGEADYDVIRRVRQALDIPVIGSGDVFSPLHLKRMIYETGCGGAVVARGALGNPWIFKEAAECFSEGRLPPHPTLEEVIQTMTRHLRSCVDFRGDRTGTMIFRKFFGWYTKGIRQIRSVRQQAFAAQSSAEMEGIIAGLRTMRVDRLCPGMISVPRD